MAWRWGTARSFKKMEVVDIDSNTVYRAISSGAGILRFEHPETAEDQPSCCAQ